MEVTILFHFRKNSYRLLRQIKNILIDQFHRKFLPFLLRKYYETYINMYFSFC